MTDQKNGQEYLSFVLEKLQARLAEISQSLLDGQKEIENMHDYYWRTIPRWTSTDMRITTISRHCCIR